eukprot:scaffold86286_cov36-Tisochrysis_lutea.AAC.2
MPCIAMLCTVAPWPWQQSLYTSIGIRDGDGLCGRHADVSALFLRKVGQNLDCKYAETAS